MAPTSRAGAHDAPAIEQVSAFGTPIFRTPLPAMAPYHDDIVELFSGKIGSGEIRPHQHGYGYQTPMTLFFPAQYPQKYFVEILAKGFLNVCESILYRHAQVDSGQAGGYAWVNTLTVGWANIQTGEVWPTDPPWHTHRPATLSGCYYVSTAPGEKEGLLEFMNPGGDSLFQPETVALRPVAGEMIIFPSSLRHRPTRSPGVERPRISLCIDSHWTLQLPHQLPPGVRPRR